MIDSNGWVRRYDKKFGWMVVCPHCGKEYFECDEQCIGFDYCPKCGKPVRVESGKGKQSND